jgi:hypothetical protein
MTFFLVGQVLLGGGQEAMSVTTTSLRQGKFEARFWHRVFEEEVGRVKGHFGPLNTYVIPHPFPPCNDVVCPWLWFFLD